LTVDSVSSSSNAGGFDQLMDLVFEIEKQTQATCGSAEGLDQALLFLSQNGNGVEQ